MSNDNQPQPDWSKVPLSDQFTWTNATSTNGRTFKIGTPKATTTSTADGAPADIFLAADNKTPFDIQVNWTGGPPPPGFANFKKPTAQETATTSITSYNLSTGPLSYNEFAFTCTEAYHFYFYDKTGDSYGNNVFWPRDGTSHIIMYFSSDPTIVRVTGS
ncbi:hypothetical protein SCARD494_05485 [Seiridium cardinale]